MEINKMLNKAVSVAYSYKETVYNTYHLAKEAGKLPGCFVECGVGAGAQIMAMELAGTGKQIWAFDSFEGIPLAGINDDQQPGIGKITHDVNMPIEKRLTSSGITSHSVENVLHNFVKNGIDLRNIEIVKGWFQNTLPKAKTGIIALLRLDGDLYESTLVCLEYLEPLVVSGGVIIIDDYALPGCKMAVNDYFCNNMPAVTEVEGGGGVVYFKK